MFQKSRDKTALIESKLDLNNETQRRFYTENYKYEARVFFNDDTGETTTHYIKSKIAKNQIFDFYNSEAIVEKEETISEQEYNKEYQKLAKDKELNNQNQFLQLLNQNNNWVTFFVKSIIQDSIKKGYETVLFPTGKTAAKVQGHETMTNEINNIEININNLNNAKGLDEDVKLNLIPKYQLLNYTDLSDENIDNSIKYWKTKIEAIEKLKPIEAFYEIRIKKVLDKITKTNLITDEYGNTWNELNLETLEESAEGIISINSINRALAIESKDESLINKCK